MALLSQRSYPYCCHDIAFQHKLEIYNTEKVTSRSNAGMILKLRRYKIQKHQGRLWSLCYAGGKGLNKSYQSYIPGGRGNLLVVAASPPTEDVATVTEPLTKQDLVSYLASGCKPKEKWRCKVMNLKFLLEENLVTKLYMSLKVKAVAEEMGLGFLGIGFQPKWELKDIPIMPKGRYSIMRNYMPKVGSLGLDMMFRTCTVQVNLDFSSEIDMIRKFRAGLALQPVSTSFQFHLIVFSMLRRLQQLFLQIHHSKKENQMASSAIGAIFGQTLTTVGLACFHLFLKMRLGVTPAERLLDLYHGKWANNVDPVFEELLY